MSSGEHESEASRTTGDASSDHSDEFNHSDGADDDDDYIVLDGSPDQSNERNLADDPFVGIGDDADRPGSSRDRRGIWR